MKNTAIKQKIPCIGLDIGTTTISAVVLDMASGVLLGSRNIPNDANIPAENSREKMQDADRIIALATGLLESLLDDHPDTKAIGVTGQMHGIVYLSADGRALSPLYTWQDERAGAGEPSACSLIAEKTGYRVSSGYGLATHCANVLREDVPEDIAKVGTIMDYLGMRLCGLREPVTHTSNAASLGLFDASRNCFDADAVKKAGMDPAILPEVTERCMVIGTYKNIPVSVAVGDNQASFYGSVREPEHMALANYGTGSQISVMSRPVKDAAADASTEIRPFIGESVLVCGSALCGGRAYALTEKFFRQYAVACGLPDTAQYDVMNALAMKGMENGDFWKMRTAFCGTRNDPTLRGSVSGIGEDNLTPDAMIAGTLYGMADELHGMFLTMPHGGIDTLVISGNAVRKNPALRKMLALVFGMNVLLPAHEEEAAFGAAMFGARAANAVSAEEASACIRYTEAVL